MRMIGLLVVPAAVAIAPAAFASTLDCKGALVVSTYKLSSDRFKDARLAVSVSSSEYEQIKHDAGAHAVIYGIPMGGNYNDFHDRAKLAASNLNSSLTESETVNILWTGIDANSRTAYSDCLAAEVLLSRGIHLVAKGASSSDLTILVRYVPVGYDPVPRAVTWQPGHIPHLALPPSIPAGDYILRVPRPHRQLQLVVNGNGVSDTIVLEPLPPAIRPDLPETITLAASDYLSARSQNVEVGGGLAAQYGPATLHNAPPYGEQPNAAEWQFTARAGGNYWLEVEYAAATPRPLNIFVNGNLVTSSGLAAATGGWELNYQQWRRQLPVPLQRGVNTIRLVRGDGVFPHILAIRFVPE